jgi:hypothetical protein
LLWSLVTHPPRFFEFGFAFWRDRGQCDSTTLFVNSGHPSSHNVADLNRLVKILDVGIGDAADVNQTTAVRRQFHKDTERHYPDDYPDDRLAGLQRFRRGNRVQDRWGVTADIAIAKWIAEPLHQLMGTACTNLPFIDALFYFPALWSRATHRFWEIFARDSDRGRSGSRLRLACLARQLALRTRCRFLTSTWICFCLGTRR